ncbi:hypothetical protein [Mucilaginibacter flavus]|uniref:hypothetical protein n=1 Tax=Mucilaginibacter flavus TaxID=931504 RepID=UPI0025B41609|nr:hypothetical protein [Mucilaginibacter flavus]MDN3583051.1 hypothetical protein [Mucilaginibacter flavus]
MQYFSQSIAVFMINQDHFAQKKVSVDKSWHIGVDDFSRVVIGVATFRIVGVAVAGIGSYLEEQFAIDGAFTASSTV